jgi:hypothetical protein
VVSKAALIVGIDGYATSPLTGCVRDATSILALLAKHDDGSPNFDCKTLLAPAGSSATVTRAKLRELAVELFSKRVDVAAFYFSGHGMIAARGGLLVTQDADRYDEGVNMGELVKLANESKINEISIIVDCCYSGALGNTTDVNTDHALLRDGVSILAASSSTETAVERGGRGLFTSVVCGALEGGAADVLGEVTSASIYAYVDQALGPWDQRPMFKANVSRLSPLRICNPVVPRDTLRRLKDWFTTEDAVFPLDPAYEQDETYWPSGTVRDEAKETTFKQFQRLRDARLLVPVGEEHLFYAAINSKACKLTHLGRFYWQLSTANRL